MEESRKITNDINNKLSAAKHIEDRLEENRKILKPLAVLATKLFFVSQSLSCLDPMYRYSMAWFISLFNSIFAKTEEKKKEAEERIVKRTPSPVLLFLQFSRIRSISNYLLCH